MAAIHSDIYCVLHITSGYTVCWGSMSLSKTYIEMMCAKNIRFGWYNYRRELCEKTNQIIFTQEEFEVIKRR